MKNIDCDSDTNKTRKETNSMTTFRKLIGNINIIKEPSQLSSLEQWFEKVMDVPIKELALEDICRAVRQQLYVQQLLPEVLKLLTEDPLAGERYDGELIAALSILEENDIKGQENIFIQIKQIINQIPLSDLHDSLRKDISRINTLPL